MASIINAATSGGLITTADTSGVLALQTAGTTAVTVDATQNVGVGTSSPTVKFQTVQTIADWTGDFKNYTAGAYGLRVDLSGSSGDKAALQVYTATGSGIIVKNDGLVGIGTFTPGYKLDVTGTAHVSSHAYLDSLVSGYIPHTGVIGFGGTVGGAQTIAKLKWGSYGRIQHASFTNTPLILFNAELYESDYAGSGSGQSNRNYIRPDYNLGSYGIISSSSGGVAFNVGNWSSNNSIDLGDIYNHSSYAGGVLTTGNWEIKNRIGIGTSVTSYGRLTVAAKAVSETLGGYVSYAGGVYGGNGTYKTSRFYHGYWGTAQEVASIGFVATSSSAGSGYGFGDIVFNTGSSGNGDAGSDSTARMRIRYDGNVLIGTETITDANGALLVLQSSYPKTRMEIRNDGGTAALYAITFYNANGLVGAITTSGTATSYGVGTSDYRLKENIHTYTGGLNAIIALRPVSFTWKASQQNDIGFIAHEIQTVIPEVVHGEKDAVDTEGNPNYQSIFPAPTQMIANLVAAIQEQQVLITQLQADVAALKGA